MSEIIDNLVDGMDLMDQIGRPEFLNLASKLDPCLGALLKTAAADQNITKEEALTVLSEYGHTIPEENKKGGDPEKARLDAMKVIKDYGLAEQDLDGRIFDGLQKFLQSKQSLDLGIPLAWEPRQALIDEIESKIEVLSAEHDAIPKGNHDAKMQKHYEIMAEHGHIDALRNSNRVISKQADETARKELDEFSIDDPDGHIFEGLRRKTQMDIDEAKRSPEQDVKDTSLPAIKPNLDHFM